MGAIYPDPLSEDKVLWGTIQGTEAEILEEAHLNPSFSYICNQWMLL